MADNDAPFFIEDTDETEISSDTAGLGNLLVTTHIRCAPTDRWRLAISGRRASRRWRA